MNKLLALSLCSSLLACGQVSAQFQTEISHEDNNETKAKAAYKLENGLSVGGEYIYDFKNKHSVEASLDAAWRFDVTKNFWVKPQVETTFGLGQAVTMPALGWQLPDSKKGNTYKGGIGLGYDFDSGFYTHARYRYERNTDTAETGGADWKFKNAVHRTDLKVGYKFSVVDMSANWIHKEGKVTGTTSLESEAIKPKWSSNEYEFKVAYTQFKSVSPYLQYTLNKDINWKDATDVERENEVKVGVVMTF